MILSHKLRTIRIFFGIGSKDVKTTNGSDIFCRSTLPQDSLHWPKFWLPRCFFTSCPPKWCGKSSWWRQTANTYLPWLEEQCFGRFRMRSQTGSVWFTKNISVGSHIIRATDMDDFRPNDWSTSLASHLFILVVRKTLALLSCLLVDSVRMRCADATGSHWKSGTFALHAYRFTAQMLQPFVPRSVYTQSRTQRHGVSGGKTLAVFDVAWWMRGLSYTSLQKSCPVIRYPLAALILHVEVQAVARASNATEIQIQSSKTWAKSCWSCWGRHSLMDERFPGSPRIALRENLVKATPIFMVIRRSWHVETCRKHSKAWFPIDFPSRPVRQGQRCDRKWSATGEHGMKALGEKCAVSWGWSFPLLRLAPSWKLAFALRQRQALAKGSIWQEYSKKCSLQQSTNTWHRHRPTAFDSVIWTLFALRDTAVVWNFSSSLAC